MGILSHRHVLLALGLIAGIVALAATAPANGAEIIQDLIPEQESLLRNSNFDAIVVTVLKVEDEGATYGDPPKLRLRVDEMLRGRARGPVIDAIWRAPIYHEDYEGPAPEQLELKDEWFSRPLSGPEIDARLIVFAVGGRETGGIAAVESHAAYAFTAANRQAVLDNMAFARRAAIQLPIFFAILFSPMLNAIFNRRAISTRTPRAAKRHCYHAIVILALSAMGLYVYYETGISTYTDIRIDLILLFPALLIALIQGFKASRRLRWARVGV